MKKHITKGQRYEISALLQAGHGKSYIAEKLKVHESTIRREIKNNCDKRSGEYNPELAQRKSEARMSSRNHFTKMDDAMKEKIDLLLYEGWSPEQIHGRLKYEGVDIVSHETIYKYVYEDKRLKGNGKGLYKHLRRKGRKYAKRGNQYKGRGIIVDRVDIDRRPNIVNENIRFGDLEGDTIIGKNRKGAIETIIDRHTGFLWMSKLSGKEASPLARKTVEMLASYKDIIHTLTVDNGKEFAKHADFAESLKIDVYFAHPYHSWERGANENANGLIRQYIPKGSDFAEVSDDYIAEVQDILNNRPRKRLGFRTPLEVARVLHPEYF
jgi:IS30 family transposase